MGSGVEDQRAVVMDAAPAATAAEGPNPGRMDVYGPAASLDGLGQGRWTQDANGELVSQLPTLEVIAPPRRRENPIVAKNWAMQGVGVLRPEIFDQQYASRARAMGYSPEELDSVRVQHKMPRPYYATEEQARAFVRQDRLLLTKVMFAPVIAGLSGGAASASPLLGAVLSGYGMYSGGQRLATAETAVDYVLGSIEVVGSALGSGYATRQLTSANGLKELVWMPLGTRGNVTPLTQRTSGWDDFGVTKGAGTGFRGSKGFELSNAPYQAVRNSPTTIGGRQYSGHALDQMQNRGLMPSVVENTIRTGTTFPTRAGTTGYFDAANNVRVITDTATGRVVTVIPGAP